MYNKLCLLVVLTMALAFQTACNKDEINGLSPDKETNTEAGDDKAGEAIPTDNDEDRVANSTFGRTVKVTFSGSSASVSGTNDDFVVSVDGAGVTITNKGDEAVIYELTGSSSNGYFKLYSTRKQEILLNGLSLTNKNGAAVNNQSHKRTFVVVKGTNTLDLSGLPEGVYFFKTTAGAARKIMVSDQ